MTALCECGCGQPAPIPTYTQPGRGYFAGQPVRFVRGHGSVQRNLLHPGRRLYAVEDRGYLTPCWIWEGAPNSQGYGRVSLGPRRVYAHVYMYEAAKGSVPEGLQLDHLCRVRMCVNPDHLEAVTSRENNRRGYAARKGRCRVDEADWDRGAALRAQGWTYQRIAEEIDVGIMSAWTYLKGVEVGTR